jgi:hypothetical protein
MLPWAIGLAVVAVALGARQLLAERRHPAEPGAGPTRGTLVGGTPATVALAVLALVVGVGSVVTIYRIGDSGSRASWTGQFSQQALPRHHPVPNR